MEKVHDNTGEKQKNSAKKKKPIGLIIAAIILIGIAAYFLFVYNFVIDATDTYYIFTEKRIAEMESKFGIILDNDVDLKKYMRDSRDIDCCKYTLEAENIDDFNEFMKNNVNGRIIDFNDSSGNKYTAYYRYECSSSEFYNYCDVYFYEADNGTYSAEFSIIY